MSKTDTKNSPGQLNQLKGAFREAVKSRVFLTLWVIIIIQTVLFLIIVLSMGRIGEPGVPVRHNGFECATCINSDNGSYLLNFVFLAIVLSVVNVLVSLKLYSVKGRNIALTVLWLTIVVFAIALFFVLGLLNRGNAL
jgi:hypothetical protein